MANSKKKLKINRTHVGDQYGQGSQRGSGERLGVENILIYRQKRGV